MLVLYLSETRILNTSYFKYDDAFATPKNPKINFDDAFATQQGQKHENGVFFGELKFSRKPQIWPKLTTSCYILFC